MVSVACCGRREWSNALGAILTLAHSRLVAPLPSGVGGAVGEEKRCPVVTVLALYSFSLSLKQAKFSFLNVKTGRAIKECIHVLFNNATCKHP